MAIIDPSNSVSSRLFTPLRECLADCRHQRACPELSDFDWLSLGVSRCLQTQTSGRGFLQSLLSMGSVYCPKQSHFFESLKSLRRLRLCFEINQRLVHRAKRMLPDALHSFEALANFDIYAADGHYHCHAVHDAPTHEGKKLPIGHIYMRNLRNGLMSHLIALNDIKRCQEHDMHALKRARTDDIRQGAPKGRKVLLVYDRAGIDFAQWWRWKASAGIYVLTRAKDNMALTTIGLLPFDERDAINAGVLSDDLVGTGGSSSEVLRRITFFDAQNDRTFEFLTNVNDTSIAPGLLAFLYRKRWDVEKSFDEFKNKLGEKKAWATSENAKQMHVQFAIALGA
jgi:Transposase DDE domain